MLYAITLPLSVVYDILFKLTYNNEKYEQKG